MLFRAKNLRRVPSSKHHTVQIRNMYSQVIVAFLVLMAMSACMKVIIAFMLLPVPLHFLEKFVYLLGGITV